MTHLSIVVPVYKAESCLTELYQRLKKTLEQLSVSFEIILVEDGGGDCSWEIIKELASQDPHVFGLQMSRNFGQHYAITAGLDYCQGDWVVVMDCDLQDKPEDIPKLYFKALEGYEVVLGNRGERKDPLHKRVSATLFYKIFNYLSGIEYDGRVGNFRIVSKKVIEHYRLMREQLRFFGAIIHWLGFKTATVTVDHAPRYQGKTTYTFRKLLRLALETIIAHSDRPLKFAIKLGFLMSFLAFSFGIYIIIEKFLYDSPVLGWSSLIVSLYFIGGIIISILGIIGIYLGKTFDEVKKRPLYIIADSTERQTR